MKMNRRDLVRRGLAGGVAGLIGLPDAKSKQREPILTEPISGGALELEEQCVEPALTIRHTGAFDAWADTIEEPSDTPPWRRFRLGPKHIKLIGLWVTNEELTILSGNNLIRVEVTNEGDSFVASGYCYCCEIRAWMQNPQADMPAFFGDFTFRIGGVRRNHDAEKASTIARL